MSGLLTVLWKTSRGCLLRWRMSFWMFLLARVRAKRLVKVLRGRMAAGGGGVVGDGGVDGVLLVS